MPKDVPTNPQSKVKKPADFDAFWDGVKRQEAAVALEPEIVLDPLRTSPDIEVFQVFYNSIDQVRIAAWYCRPAQRAARTPAILLLPGYQADPPIPKDWARRARVGVASRDLEAACAALSSLGVLTRRITAADCIAS
jgi:cephalosporin-C deacetylase-like acetyl esterase